MFPLPFPLFLMFCPLHLSPLSIFDMFLVSMSEKLILDSSFMFFFFATIVCVFAMDDSHLISYGKERIPQGIIEKKIGGFRMG